jgi:hypothetical protein
MLEILLQAHGTCRGTFGEQCGSQAEFEAVEYFHTLVDHCVFLKKLLLKLFIYLFIYW